jgi:hypothetical protein
METLLWAIDLIAVVYLCHWAWKQDGGQDRNKNNKVK